MSHSVPAWPRLVAEYLRHLEVLGRCAKTRELASRYLHRFFSRCAQRHLDASDVQYEDVLRYQRELREHIGSNGVPLSAGSVDMSLRFIRSFYRWAARRELLVDPTADLVLSRVKRAALRRLSPEDVQALLDAPASDTSEGLRDRAVLDTMYSAGLRREECQRLNVQDYHVTNHQLLVRGKGCVLRLVPVGESLAAVLNQYLDEGRIHLARPDENALFVTRTGTRFTVEGLTALVWRNSERAGLGRVGCHLLRHACATHMLEAGADVVQVKTLLGHEHLASTAVYAHITADELAKVYRRTHPRANRVTDLRDAG